LPARYVPILSSPCHSLRSIVVSRLAAPPLAEPAACAGLFIAQVVPVKPLRAGERPSHPEGTRGDGRGRAASATFMGAAIPMPAM
jgi:hypothetical protein